jgi:ribonuclease HI
MAAWLRAQVEADQAAASALIGDGCTGIWEIDHYRAVRDSGSPARLFDGVVHDRATWRTVDVARARHADAQARHIAIHGPRDENADCDAKLAALDLCERVIREDAGKHDDCGADA